LICKILSAKSYELPFNMCFLFTRFRDGLTSLGVLDALQRYPLQTKCLFVKAEKVENDVSLEDILVFFTGCDSIPALGFSPKPSLEFITHSRFPVANTCENILRIPVHAEYTDFRSDMNFAIRNSPGFGRLEHSHCPELQWGPALHCP
uniref:HECT domain-containing protein n=1 Tax=Sander lucioperca TaxID=283035 RepID=A0A8C9YPL1_SANLU